MKGVIFKKIWLIWRKSWSLRSKLFEMLDSTPIHFNQRFIRKVWFIFRLFVRINSLMICLNSWFLRNSRNRTYITSYYMIWGKQIFLLTFIWWWVHTVLGHLNEIILRVCVRCNFFCCIVLIRHLKVFWRSGLILLQNLFSANFVCIGSFSRRNNWRLFHVGHLLNVHTIL